MIKIYIIYNLLLLKRTSYQILGNLADKLGFYSISHYSMLKWMSITGRISNLLLN